MNILELKEILKSEKIPERYYLLEARGIREDKICLEFTDDVWQVYYSERGEKYNAAEFPDESGACGEMLQRLRKKNEKRIKREQDGTLGVL